MGLSLGWASLYNAGMDERFVSVRRAAEVTGYTERWIRALAREGKIKVEKRGRRWIVDLGDLVAYIRLLGQPRTDKGKSVRDSR